MNIIDFYSNILSRKIDNKQNVLESKKAFPVSDMVFHSSDHSRRLIENDIINRKIYEKYFLVGKDDVVVDIGAHVGFFTILCLYEGKAEKIFCVEPFPTNFDDLIKNINKFNFSKKTVLVNKAIAGKSGVQYVGFCGDMPGIRSNYRDTPFENSVEIHTISFLDFVRENNIKKIDFLKLDCEGGEYHILHGKENLSFIQNNVDKISGELHFCGEGNSFLQGLEVVNDLKAIGFDVILNSVDGLDITESFFSKSNFYTEIMFYAKNKNYDKNIFRAGTEDKLDLSLIKNGKKEIESEDILKLYKDQIDRKECGVVDIKKQRGNDIIVINAYPDSEFKMNTLRKCVSQLKKTDKDILLVTHYPIDNDVQKMVDYFIYDQKNTLLDVSDFYWYKNSEIYYQSKKFNIGRQSYAVLSSIQNAIGFISYLGKDFFYHFDYDCIIDDKDLYRIDQIKERVGKENKRGYVQVCDMAQDCKGIIANFFAFDVSFYLKEIGIVRSSKDYISKGTRGIMLELYLYDQLIHKKNDLIMDYGDGTFKIKYFNNSQNDFCQAFASSVKVDIIKDKDSSDVYLIVINGERDKDVCVQITASESNIIQLSSQSSYIQKIENMELDVSVDVLENDIYKNVYLNKPSTVVRDRDEREYIEILGNRTLVEKNSKESEKNNSINLSTNFIDGAFCEITGDNYDKYCVEFINSNTNEIIHKDTISTNHWVRTSIKYFVPWLIKVSIQKNGSSRLISQHLFDAKGKKVLIFLDSSSLGDTIAWFPYIEEFRKKHECQVVCSTFFNKFFQNKYKELQFVAPGTSVEHVYAQYVIGWFSPLDLCRNKIDYREIPLQKCASDILGLDYKEIRPEIDIPSGERKIKEKYVCIGVHSTAQAKYWNYPGGWQKVVDYLNGIGYKVVLISKERGSYMGNRPPFNIIDKSGDIPIEERMIDLKYCDFYIGIGSGLSWLAWAVGSPVILISGFSDPMCEFTTNVKRIHNRNVCNSCFNDSSFVFDKGDWNWCPRLKNFECTRMITPEMVIKKIDEVILEIQR